MTRRAPLGKFLESELQRQGQNWAWLADKMDVSPAAVAKWARTGQIRRSNAKRLSEVLGCGIEDIFAAIDGSKVPTKQTDEGLSTAAKRLLVQIKAADAKGALDNGIGSDLSGIITRLMVSGRGDSELDHGILRQAIADVQGSVREAGRGDVEPPLMVAAIMRAYREAIDGEKLPRQTILRLIKG